MDDGTGVPGSALESASVPGDLPLDMTKYRDDLAGLEISEDQWRELLETMWSIMRLFVEFGYSYDVSGRALMEIFRHAARGDEGDGT